MKVVGGSFLDPSGIKIKTHGSAFLLPLKIFKKFYKLF
jgi:hypothetical protein